MQTSTKEEKEVEEVVESSSKISSRLPQKQSEGLKRVSALYNQLIQGAKAPSLLNTTAGQVLAPKWKKGNAIEKAQASSSLYDGSTLAAPSLMGTKPLTKPETLGKGWFDMQPAEMTEELQRDIKVIELRNYIDPKRFYKSLGKIRKVLHVGTIVEGPTEFRSARLTNKERKQTITEELLADRGIKDYTKRTYLQIQDQHLNKRKFHKSKKHAPLRKRGKNN